MQFPQLPTDNLYKFMTIVGIIFVVIPLFLTRQLPSIEKELALIQKSLDLSDADFAALKRRNSSDIEELEKSGATREQVDELKRKVEQRYKEHMAAYDALIIRNTSVKADLNSLEKDTRNYGFLFYLGLVVAGFGLFSWYWQHQRFQDEILRSQARDAVANSNSQPTSDQAHS